MQTYLIEMLECPACHGDLDWRILEGDENRIETAEVHCTACAAIYPIRQGIGMFLTPDLHRNDLWEQVDSGLIQYLRKHPKIERQLMDVPADTLGPADRFFRALVLDERGDYFEAKKVEDSTQKDLYTPEHIHCLNSQTEYILEHLAGTEGPIVDLASGRGYLVEKLIRRLNRPVIATDFSPLVLQRDRRWLESIGLYDLVTLLAFDARRTPFVDGAVAQLTTNLGLPNIEKPGSLLKELRRIVDGQFMAISHFYPEEDEENAKVIREAGLEPMLFRRSALEHFALAGWRVEANNTCVGEARPTPSGILLEGARIDGMPVADTYLEWCVLMATNKVFS